MATSTNVQVILDAKDNASHVIHGVGDNAKKAGNNASEAFTRGGLAAGGFLAAITGLGVAMANVAGDFEQNRISFEVMLGSAEAGRKALTDLSNFAVKTPFELPQLLQASKSLLAYGIEAENLIPTLKNMGDIASGVGMDKLPNLILAFGQVKAATRLTGMELRQFTEAGVPMLQLLVDQANKAGGAWVTVGGGAKKAKVDLKETGDQLAIANQKMKEWTESGKHSESSMMSLRNRIENLNGKMAEGSITTGAATKVWQKHTVTVAEMKDMISDGAVSFDMVQKALQSATGEGGKFFNMMERQSKTFGGVMSNIKDQVTRSLAEIAGIDIQAGGLIREGSMFSMMKQGAEGFLNVLNVVTPILVKFTSEIMKSKIAVMAIVGAIGGAIVLAVGAFIVAFGAGLLILAKFLIIGAAIGAAIGLIVELFGGWSKVTKGVSDAFGALMTAIQPVLNELRKAFDVLVEKVKVFGESFQELMRALKPVTDFIGDKVVPLMGTAVVQAIKGWIKQLTYLVEGLSILIDWVTKAIDATTDFVNYVKSGKLSKAIDDEYKKAENAVMTFVTNTKAQFDIWVNNSKTAFDTFKTNATNTFTGWITTANTALQPWRENFLGTLGKTLEDVALAMYAWDLETIARWQETLGQWGVKITEGLTIAGEVLTTFFTETLPTRFTEGFNAVLETVTVFFTETLPTKFTEGWAILSENVMNFFTKTLPEIFTTGWETVLANVTVFFTETLPNAFNIGWENLKTLTITKLTEMWTQFTEGWRANGEESPMSFLDGWLSSEPSMAGKIVEKILQFIGIILLTLVVGLVEVGIRATVAFRKSIVGGITGFIEPVKEAIQKVINAIKTMVDNFKPKFSIGLELPDIVGAWNNLKAKAKSIGIPGYQTGGIVPGPIGSPQLAMVHGGEEIKSIGTTTAGSTGGGGGGVTFNVHVGIYAGSETEKRNVAKQLYGALLQVAQSQNKNVQEYMGG